jgi:type II secretory ATPase GspE/PulE/Tfp pilus assembly ATPase PilB-like protein
MVDLRRLIGGAILRARELPSSGVVNPSQPTRVLRSREYVPSAAAPTTSEPPAGRAAEALQAILARALAGRASDIHLEMLASGLRVRFRIDGVLRTQTFGPLQATLDTMTREVVSRVKILAKLDIAERRRPQDGSFRITIDRDAQRIAIDLRVSVVPSYTGESVVIRVLDRSRAPRSIAELRLAPSTEHGLRQLLTRTTGIVLVTGPTGSGKSTTLYACLMHLYRPEIRILTAEDPVEYVYDELSQCEVNEDIGNTFASYLRVFLRHDPEVIMVGEIRDQPTAEMAFRAAQTGHLLLSTLHTNSAITALPRLLDLRIEPSLVAASLAGVLSQRLARRICDACRQEDRPDDPEVEQLFGRGDPPVPVYRGAGCPACDGTGYRGRLIIADLWVPDAADTELIARGAPLDAVARSAKRTTASMADDGRARLLAGETTIEELRRVLPHEAIEASRSGPDPAT